MGGHRKSGFAWCAVLLLACGSSIDVVDPQGGGGASTSSGTGAGNTTTSGTGGTSTGSSGTGGVTSSSGTSTTSSGTTSTSSSGELPPPDEWCSDCAEPAIDGPCAWAWEACEDHFACSQLLKCHTDCEWTQDCNEACDDIIPSGVPLFHDLMFCVACEVCDYACAGSSLMVYCY